MVLLEPLLAILAARARLIQSLFHGQTDGGEGLPVVWIVGGCGIEFHGLHGRGLQKRNHLRGGLLHLGEQSVVFQQKAVDALALVLVE